MNVMEQIRIRTFKLCEERKIPIGHLVERSGIDPGYMQAFIAGRAEDMELNDLLRLSCALGLSLPAFFKDPLFGETQKNPPLPGAETPDAKKEE